MPREKNPRKKGKWKPKGAFDMEQLPQPLVMDILSRLPIKTLCNCRYVCKDWLHMIHGPEFARLHLQRSPISILIKTSPPRREQSRLELIHVEKSDGSRMRVDRMRFAFQNSIPCSLSRVNLINSCNGFICLSDGSRDGSLYVCNPILGQYISIPSPDKDRKYSPNITAIGFSAKTKEYKVVQTSYRDYNLNEPEAMIYTIGTGVWRSIGKPPRCGQIPFNSFLHGALHWVPYVDYGCTPQSIQSFNFEREEFRPLPLPPVSLKQYNEYDGFRLGVLKGCIFSCVFESNRSDDTHDMSLRTVDMWIMKDYGVQESWTRIFVIKNLSPYSSYEPVMFLNDVEMLMTHKRKSMVHYDKETNCLQETRIIKTRSEFQALGYCPSFVSLRDVSNGEEVKSLRDNQNFSKLFCMGSNPILNPRAPEGSLIGIPDPRDAVGRCMDVSKGFTFTEVNSVRASPSKVSSCHFSSDGKLLTSGGHDKKAVLWYTDSLKPKSTLEEHSALITDVRFSPSMPRLATSSFDKTVRVWDADNPGYSLRTFMGHNASVMSVDFHPNKDDLICSCDWDGEIRYWSINSGSCTRVFKGGTTQVRFQPRFGRYLAAAAENVVSILDVETQACRHSLQGHTKPINYVCWDPSGEFLASLSEDSVRVWTFGSGNEGECVHELSCNGIKFHSCVFHPTYTSLLVIGCYQSLELWNMTENKIMTLSAHEGLIASLAVSTVTCLVASASHDKWVRLWK